MPLLHRRCLAILAVLAGALTSSGTAHGQTQGNELRWNPVVDLTVINLGAAMWIGTQTWEGSLVPATCRWCGVDPLDLDIRRALVWHHPATANVLSDVGAFALLPAAAVGLEALAASHDGAGHRVPVDVGIVAEATVLAADVNAVTKVLVGRERPDVHALSPEEKARTPRRTDDNLSFFSGHATEAFALATSAGTVASLRGYRWAPVVWSAGLPLAFATAYLRIAADRHWFTDVAVGTIVGAGLGVGIPCVFHRADPVRAAPAPSGVRMASFSFAW
ncbi:MAG TPA: phosphatase PAP2 family protein [Polyangiaceae bacterium]|jgi:membrane-associated phospholipid phosphatase